MADQSQFENVIIKWTLDGTNIATKKDVRQVVPSKAFINSNNKRKFIIKRNSLTISGDFIVNL
jgi:hypothetical protein